MRILVVEDDAPLAEVLRRGLTEMAMQPTWSASSWMQPTRSE